MRLGRVLVVLVALVVLASMQLAAAGSVPVEVHPAGATIPENLLRFELRFAQPQRLPFDNRRLLLVDAAGIPIENALLDLTLPDADGRRISVLMDPGRVKTDAGPNRSAGRALQAGSTVRLVIAGAAPGEPPFVKQWTVTGVDSELPQPSLWRLNEPRVRSRDSLVVDMHKPISSSGEGLIAVRDAKGRRVRGSTRLSDSDTVWRFVPAQPWREGSHALVIHPDLEDPAGNRSCVAFEQIRASEVRCDAAIEIPFHPAVVSRHL